MYQAIDKLRRTKPSKKERIETAIKDPKAIIRERNNRSLFEFLLYFWPEISNDELVLNWHIQYLCYELEKVAYNVANNITKEYDLLINIPPGTTKTIIVCIAFPAWCWTNWFWLRVITCSYSQTLALESAEYSRDLIKSARFRELYPELDIKDDKDTKGNFKVVKKEVVSVGRQPKVINGGNRYSTSVLGTLTGFHGHILIWDDPINPHKSQSDVERATVNRWLGETFSTRKTNKKVTVMIGVMQRLHKNDPTGYLLDKKKNIRHICLPGEIRNYREVLKPAELAKYYVDDLLDVTRMPWSVLKEMEADLGQYGYAGQCGQKPTPPSGGMFKTENFQIIEQMPPTSVFLHPHPVRYWDKAGSTGTGAYTAGVKMYALKDGKFLITACKRGQWGTNVREKIIKHTAQADGYETKIWIEQEPGSGGKESAESTIANLAGFSINKDRPVGDKVFRADPYSVQVNEGNVYLLRGDWNAEFIEEHSNFPNGKYKDQVDASSGAFTKLVRDKSVKVY